MKKSLVIVLFFLTAICYSQILFEKGYFIDNSNQKYECLIKNIDWSKTPTEFSYKDLNGDIVQKKGIENVKEFSIYGKSKYIREVVLIDRSGNVINDMSRDRNPLFKEETLFLKVLVEGDVFLYEYSDVNLIRYFYKTKETKISQLVYKKYMIDTMMGENNNFRQQILNSFQQFGVSLNDVSNLKYDRKQLEKLFVKLNKNSNPVFVQPISTEKKDLFNINIRPGISFTSLSVSNVQPYRNVDFGQKIELRLAVEAEIILPFNNNKWSVIVEPTFRSFKSEKKLDEIYNSFGFYGSKVNYQSIELPIGIRHYFFLKNKSKIFINSSVLFHIPGNSNLEYFGNNDVSVGKINIKTPTNLALGVGYKFQDKYGVEFRYHTNNSLIADGTYDANYKSISLIVGYTIF